MPDGSDIPGTALALLPPTAVSIIVAADKDDILRTLAAKVAAHQPDISTKAGRDAMRSLAYEVAHAKVALVKIGKGLTEEWRASTKAVNDECRLIEDRLDGLRDQVRAPLTAYENAEAERVKAHADAVAAIKEHPDYYTRAVVGADPPTDYERRLAHLRAYPARDWQEFADVAAQALAVEIAINERALALARKREADAAELATLRAEQAERARQEAERKQAEREALIRREAAEQARIAAEQESFRVAAAARAQAEQARIAAEEEASRLVREADYRARQAEAERAAAEQRALQAEGERMAAHAAAIRRIRNRATFPFPDPPAIVVSERIAEIEEADGRDWQDFAAEAAEAKAAALASLGDLLRDALDRDNARLAAQEAENAAREQRDAEARAAMARARDEQMARDAAAAVGQAVANERQRLAEENAAAAAAAVRRTADKARRQQVHNEAMTDLVKAGVIDKAARAAVNAIAGGGVAHVAITY